MKRFILLLLLTIPILSFSQTTKNQIKIIHPGYTVVFDTTLDYPTVVNWIDTKARLGCENKIPRKDNFEPDPKLESQTDLQDEYENINKLHKQRGFPGVDRGHMCPAADNQCNQQYLNECFYFSNMAPQYHSLNAGDWKKAEVLTRDLSLQYDSVYVWCGSVGVTEKVNGLAIPAKCWKVLYVKSTKTWYAWIFINSTAKPVGLENCQVKKEQVEKLTGLKFEIY